jgi:bacteriocin-like protein
MPTEPTDYVLGKIMSTDGELTDEELELISGGSYTAIPCPNPVKVLCPPGYTRCTATAKCSP